MAATSCASVFFLTPPFPGSRARSNRWTRTVCIDMYLVLLACSPQTTGPTKKDREETMSIHRQPCAARGLNQGRLPSSPVVARGRCFRKPCVLSDLKGPESLRIFWRRIDAIGGVCHQGGRTSRGCCVTAMGIKTN